MMNARAPLATWQRHRKWKLQEAERMLQCYLFGLGLKKHP